MDCGHWDSAHTQETTQTTDLDFFGDMPSKKKRKVASDAVSDGRPGRQRKSMICTHSEAHDADGGFVVHRNTAPQTSCNLFGWVETHCQRFHFWCCEKRMTLGMRVTPTNAEPGERRQVSNILDSVSVSSAGWPHLKHVLWHAAEAHRQFRLPLVASSPSDEERSLSFGFSTSAAVDCASICDGCCRVHDGRPWSGERHGLRHRSCAAWLTRTRRNLAALRVHCSQF